MEYNLSSLVKVLKVENQYYGYDAASRLLCELDRFSAAYLSSGCQKDIPGALQGLLDEGVFATPRFRQCVVNTEDIPKMVGRYVGNVLPRKLVLEVTENCNLRCKYCFNTIGDRVRTHTRRQMDETTACAAIDYFFKCFTEKISKVAVQDRKDCLKKLKPIFSLWGGEPFLNFGLIKKSKAYFDGLPWGDFGVDKDDFICSVVTNFTVFNDEILDFLVSNRVLLAISLDGSRDVHDRNRVFVDGRGSYDQVQANLSKLYLSAPDYCRKWVKFHVVYDGKDELEEAQKFFETYLYDGQGEKKFAGVSCLQQAKPKEAMDFSVREEENEKSLLAFQDKLNMLALLSEYELEQKILNGEVAIDEFLKLFEREEKLHFDHPEVADRCARTLSCPIGTSQIAVGVDGNIHVCYKSDESYPIGNVKTGGVDVTRLIRVYSEYYLNFQNECKQCWAFRFCLKCPSNMLKNGKFVPSGKAECEYVRKMNELGLKKYILFATNEKVYDMMQKYRSNDSDKIFYV